MMTIMIKSIFTVVLATFGFAQAKGIHDDAILAPLPCIVDVSTTTIPRYLNAAFFKLIYPKEDKVIVELANNYGSSQSLSFLVPVEGQRKFIDQFIKSVKSCR